MVFTGAPLTMGRLSFPVRRGMEGVRALNGDDRRRADPCLKNCCALYHLGVLWGAGQWPSDFKSSMESGLQLGDGNGLLLCGEGP